MPPSGEITSADDHGSIWQLWYKDDADGVNRYVHFDHRMFAGFYEGVTGNSFFADYNFGVGHQYVSDQLKGRHVRVEGDPFQEVVYVDD